MDQPNHHMRRGQDFGGGRGGYDQHKGYRAMGKDYGNPNRGNFNRPFDKRERRMQHRQGRGEEVFNMGGIKGEIIGSDMQRISFNKGEAMSLSNRVPLGRPRRNSR